MKKRATLLALLSFLFFSSCKSEKSCEKTCCVKINLQHIPTSLDPLFCRNLSSLFIARHLHEGLFRYDQDQAVPALCESYHLSDDLRTIRITLKKAHYSDGSVIEAKDFLSSALKALDPAYPCDYAHLLFNIKNAKGIHEGKINPSELGVKVISSDVIEYHLEEPSASFFELLTHPVFFASKKGLYSGPFQLRSYNPGTGIVLEKNPFYHDAGSVDLTKLEGYFVSQDTAVIMFDQNKLHFIGSPLSSIPQEAIQRLVNAKTLTKKAMLGTCFLRVNTLKNPLSNLSFRQQLAQAISRDSIVNLALENHHIKSETLVPPQLKLGLSIYQSQALDVSFVNKSSQGSFTLKFSMQDPRLQKVACVIKESIERKLPIKIDLVPCESKMLFQDLSQGNYELMMGSWLADVADPENFLSLFADKDLPVNGTGWDNQNFKDLLSLAKNHSVGRLEYYKKAEELLLEQCPIIPLFQFNMIYAKDENLKGVELNSLGILDFKHAKF